jgi:hypothetical protein
MKIAVASRISQSRNSASVLSANLCAYFLEVSHASAATETCPFGFCIFRDGKQWARSGRPAFGTGDGAQRFSAIPGV